MNTEWMARGKCQEVAPDLFFPSDGMGVLVAQKICAECPVSAACLEYALENHIDHGVWGGCSERERRRILRRRRMSQAVTVVRPTRPAQGPAAPLCRRTRRGRLARVTIECVVNVSEGRDQAFLGELADGGRPGPARSPSRPGPPSIGLHPGRRGRRRHARGPGAGPGERGPSRSRHASREPIRAWACSMSCRSSPTTPAGSRATTSAPSSPCATLRPVDERHLGRADLPLRTPSRRRRTVHCPRSDGMPSPELAARFRAPRGPTAPPGRPRSGPDRCWWPTTCGSPRSRWHAGWHHSSAVPRCVPWAWPSATGAQVSCNLVDPAQLGPAQAYDAGGRLRRGGRGSRDRGRTGRACSPRRS